MVQYTILLCSRLSSERNGIVAPDEPDIVREMMPSRDAWDRLTRKIGHIMTEKDICVWKRAWREGELGRDEASPLK